ncbi:MAG: TatD family hydrolase [Deltaproteobacteria bacterium]|nr:TatD family hydrolase [Deltaproteobacteria bacterium]
MLVDCHSHLHDPDFDADRQAVIARAAQAGVGVVLCAGQDRQDNERAAQICASSALLDLRPCFGFHPDRFADERPLPGRAELDALLAQIRARASEIAALSEVGLDRWVARSEQRRQAQARFLEQLAGLAVELDLPLVVHSRSAGHYAIDLLRSTGARRVLMHAFDGKASHASRAAGDGFFFSIPPSVMRSDQKRKLVRCLPLEALCLESDAPALGPERGVPSEPAQLALVVRAVAEIRNIDPELVEQASTRNARRLFGLQLGR